jgi:hypothetical protein
MFEFKILFAIIFIIISDENVNQVFSQIHVRVAYLFFQYFVDFETKFAESFFLKSIIYYPGGK